MAVLASLKSLQTELMSARRIYEECLRVTTNPEVAAVVAELLELRLHAERQIREILEAAGAEPDEQGTFTSFVHRAVASVRTSMFGDGVESLPAFAIAEASILLAYNNAIDECRPCRKIANLLERQRAELVRAVMKLEERARRPPTQTATVITSTR